MLDASRTGMPTIVDRHQVQRLLAGGAQLVEVLPREEYDEAHIAGAVSMPLDDLGPDLVRALDRARPVITYCSDSL